MTHISNWVGTRETGDTAEVPTKFELPYDAVKEAIVNAVVHRDYTSNASVQVMLFKDRLEVWSPGGLPRGMTIGKLSTTHKSVPVNPLLARAMYLKGYIEKAGTGTEDMIAKCREWGIPAPEWREEEAEDFRVILKRPVDWDEGINDGVPDVIRQTGRGHSRESRDRREGEGRDRKPAEEAVTARKCNGFQQSGGGKSRDRGGIGSRDRNGVVAPQEAIRKTLQGGAGNVRGGRDKSKHVVVALIGRFPKIKQTEMAKATGLSTKGVEKILAQLKDAGVIARVGGKRFGHWEIMGKEPG